MTIATDFDFHLFGSPTAPEYSDTITVEDVDGLAALPLGTLIAARFGGNHYERVEKGYVQAALKDSGWAHTWPVPCMREGGWLPATIVNPEVLGEFYHPLYRYPDPPNNGVLDPFPKDFDFLDTSMLIPDREALDALPAGVYFRPVRACSQTALRTLGDGHYEWMLTPGRADDDYAYDLPGIVLNPEVLGEFYTPEPLAEWERELLDGPKTYTVGDRIDAGDIDSLPTGSVIVRDADSHHPYVKTSVGFRRLNLRNGDAHNHNYPHGSALIVHLGY